MTLPATRICAAFLLSCAALLLAVPAAASVAETDARETALAWLHLIDEERYMESWNEAGSLLKGQISVDLWELEMSGLRQQIGASASREFLDLETFDDPSAVDHLPGLASAPTGEYVRVRYQGRFSKLDRPISETVVLTQEDGRWRVVSYYAGSR